MLQRLRVHIKTMEDVDTTVTNPIITVKEGAVDKTTGIGAEVVVVNPTVILHITVGHTECVLIQENTVGHQQTDTRRMRCGATGCWYVRKNAPDRSG